MAQPIAKVAGRLCSNCGGQVTFKPGSDAVECGHCGHVQGIEKAEIRTVVEYDFASARTTAPTGAAAEIAQGGREVQCTTCGARAVVTGQATRCPFCDAPVVVEIPDSPRQILPESVLPFALDQQAAQQAFQTWMKSRWFAPNDLVRRSRHHGLDGVYLPYWTYDSSTTTSYSGQRGDHYYETEHYTDAHGKRRTRQIRKTRWHHASGTVHVDFDDVLVCASSSLPIKLIEKLEPWDLHELRGFDDRYLAGFTAERYAVDLEQGFRLAENRMEPEIRGAIRRDIGGDEQRIHSMDVRHAGVTFKHLLVPLWISAFRYRDDIYRVVVNARTGEVSGERPWSWIKIALLVIVLAAIAAGLAVLFSSRSG